VLADPEIEDSELRESVIDLLGVLAYGELTAFERLVADASLAPSLLDKAAIAQMAVVEFAHFQGLRKRLASMGVDPEAAMTPFVDAIDLFHEQTRPKDWLEGLVKVYVGDGIAADFYREVAEYIDPSSRELVLTVLMDSGHSAFTVERVRAAIQADPAIAGRLSLWARRLVGEALVQAQRVAVDRGNLAALVGGMGGLAGISRMFGRLTDAHAARLTTLGLTA
jgi:hypothetical protein